MKSIEFIRRELDGAKTLWLDVEITRKNIEKISRELKSCNDELLRDELEKYRELLTLQKAHLLREQKNIIGTIDRVKSQLSRTLLTAYYINYETVEDIAEKMNISVRHAYRLRRRAQEDYRQARK